MEDPAVDLDRADEQLEEERAVRIGTIDVLPLVAALGDVPDRAGKLESQRT